VHELGRGVRNGSRSARSDPLSETSESMERAGEATSAEGIARCASRGRVNSARPERARKRLNRGQIALKCEQHSHSDHSPAVPFLQRSLLKMGLETNDCQNMRGGVNDEHWNWSASSHSWRQA
jgi:hypothetical protein